DVAVDDSGGAERQAEEGSGARSRRMAVGKLDGGHGAPARILADLINAEHPAGRHKDPMWLWGPSLAQGGARRLAYGNVRSPPVSETLTLPAPRTHPVVGYVAALALTALATVGAILVEQTLATPNLSLIFVLPVVIGAAAYGWGPAALAAVAGALCFNFFLIEPRYTFAV